MASAQKAWRKGQHQRSTCVGNEKHKLQSSETIDARLQIKWDGSLSCGQNAGLSQDALLRLLPDIVMQQSCMSQAAV